MESRVRSCIRPRCRARAATAWLLHTGSVGHVGMIHTGCVRRFVRVELGECCVTANWDAEQSACGVNQASQVSLCCITGVRRTGRNETEGTGRVFTPGAPRTEWTGESSHRVRQGRVIHRVRHTLRGQWPPSHWTRYALSPEESRHGWRAAPTGVHTHRGTQRIMHPGRSG